MQPRHVAALNLIGIVLTRAGRFTEAETFLRRALRENGKSDATHHNYGVVLRSLSRPEAALQHFSQALQINPKFAETWNLRGAVLLDLNRPLEAIADFEHAISLNPAYAEAFYNMARALDELQRYDNATAAYDRALALDPGLADAWFGHACSLHGRGRMSEALAAYERGLARKPDSAAAWLSYGNVHGALKHSAAALQAYDKALALEPNYALAHSNRASVLLDLKRYDDALSSSERAMALKPDLALAYGNRGAALHRLGRLSEALASLDRAIAIDHAFADAYSNRAILLLKLKRYGEALESADRAIALNPTLAVAHDNRAAILLAVNRFNEALPSCEQAVALDASLASAHVNCGLALLSLGRYEDALVSCDRAFKIDPSLPYLQANRLHAKQYICKWDNLDTEISQLGAALHDDETKIVPFPVLSLVSDPADQFKCMRREISANWAAAESPVWRGEIYGHDRIRLAYLSSDLREHAVAYQTVGMFEHHDRSRFETTALSWGPGQNSDFARRVSGAFDHFIDVSSLEDRAIAELIRQREIDIVVDLNGFTKNARPGLFTWRPAPIVVNYLGYSGTMGADFYDYILADATVIPKEHFPFYSEKVVWLPHSFFVNDDKRTIAEPTPTRLELGLPEQAFVFCCFNQPYKLSPSVFDIWMRLLKAVDGSVLWLRQNSESASQNLRTEAERRGVSPERLVFAGSVASQADHLARLRQADLFLDTLPYNAHATASDALWAGVPVVTCLGPTFAGRIAASQLRAVGLGELVTEALPDYEALALKIATDPTLCAALKTKLCRNRSGSALFDTAMFTRHIEKAYRLMWQRAERGLPPESMSLAAEENEPMSRPIS